MGMHGLGLISSPHVVAAFDLGRFRHLVDLGGATGHLAIAACEHYPDLGPRSSTCPTPSRWPGRSSRRPRSGVGSRSSRVISSPIPCPTGDLYALGRILHDWSEAEDPAPAPPRSTRRYPVGGAVLIAEKLVNDDRTGPIGALMQDLNMLTCTEGRERTLEAVREPAARSRLRRCSGRPDDIAARCRHGGPGLKSVATGARVLGNGLCSSRPAGGFQDRHKPPFMPADRNGNSRS